MPNTTLVCTDCLEWMRAAESDSVDLVFGSPPYEDCRTYGINFSLQGQEWVDWMVEITCEAVRVSRGLVAFVVEGKTRKFRWSATPVLLMADLHRAGVHLRKPPVFHRIGIPGSGGPDWLRNDYEFIVCATSGGKLPWSDNTACGHAPRCPPGGEMSYRHADGTRKNGKPHTKTREKRMPRSDTKELQMYRPPEQANPGNVITCKVGGGLMGNRLAHENEAPFPEQLAEAFLLSFCPPNGTVLDPFCGSGTTLTVAKRYGRNGIGIDVRQSQIDITKERLKESFLSLEYSPVKNGSHK